MTEQLLDRLENEFDERAGALEALDACAWLGRPAKGFAAYLDAQALVRAARHYGIRGGLVGHTAGILVDPIEGDDILARELPHLPGWAGIMTLLPPGTGETADPAQHIAARLAQNFRAARLLPKTHRFTLRAPTMPALFSELEKRRVPLLIPIGETSWDEIGALALARPALTIIVEGAGHHEYLNVRSGMPWLEAARNLVATTNRQFLCGGVEWMVERLGAERIVLATNQPMDDLAGVLGHLAWADLLPQERLAIAHGNLARILAAVETEVPHFPFGAPDSPFRVPGNE